MSGGFEEGLEPDAQVEANNAPNVRAVCDRDDRVLEASE